MKMRINSKLPIYQKEILFIYDDLTSYSLSNKIENLSSLTIKFRETLIVNILRLA